MSMTSELSLYFRAEKNRLAPLDLSGHKRSGAMNVAPRYHSLEKTQTQNARSTEIS
jgi:hypothetical protein